MTAKCTRRTLLRAGLGIGSALAIGDTLAVAAPEDSNADRKESKALTVAAVQFRSSADLDDNVRRHCDYVRRCADDGARLIVFPECSITGYDDKAVENATPRDLRKAEAAIGAAAEESGAYVIAGIPTKMGSVTYNSAIVITPEAKVIERYHKVQLAGEKWATPGDHLGVFPIFDTLCSIIICHDERYPELVRLPVIAGARIVMYVSHESGMKEAQKIEPYRAQICARAVENNVYIVHANAPADKETLAGSHGQSRIIDPGGHITCEAGIYDEEVVTASLDLKKASGGWAQQSLGCEFLKGWWEEGVRKVRVIR